MMSQQCVKCERFLGHRWGPYVPTTHQLSPKRREEGTKKQEMGANRNGCFRLLPSQHSSRTDHL
jgi:DNA-directed RNA polymerase subunit N (RpoN/RPB10)